MKENLFESAKRIAGHNKLLQGIEISTSSNLEGDRFSKLLAIRINFTNAEMLISDVFFRKQLKRFYSCVLFQFRIRLSTCSRSIHIYIDALNIIRNDFTCFYMNR